MSERQASRTSRLLEIERLLLLASQDGLSAHEIAEQMEVDRRTIYRDIEFLCEQGVPVWQENGRFGINRTHYLTNVRLSFHESIALVLAGLLLSRTIDERNPHVAAALEKLAAHLPNPLSSHLKRAAQRVQSRNDSQGQVGILEAIAEGWGTGQKVKINYRSPRNGTIRQRILSPYALEPTPSGIYVVGYDDLTEEVRTFKLDRMESAVVLKSSYTIPEQFNMEAHLATGWRIMSGGEPNEVVLRFKPAVVAQVRERQWHSSQKLEGTADGGCVLRVQVAQPVEMQPWIHTWGAEVEVLAPEWLRQKIATELRQAADQYAPLT